MNRKPPRLRPGDGIGVMAPAGPVTPLDMEPGIRLLESMGYRVVLSRHLYDRHGFLAGEDDFRLEDLHAMFADRDLKALICARGGYGTLRLLNRIDFDLIGKNPKILVGYSDITALLLAVQGSTGLVTFHGPMVRNLAEKGRRSLEVLFDTLSSGGPSVLDLSGGVVIRGGLGRGRVFGGNLSLICHLVGTPFMPPLEGAILFIEDRGEPLYRIDRMLTHLRLSGHLEGLSGMIAGEFRECGDRDDVYRIILDRVSDLKIPVLGGMPVGHGEENIAVPIGIESSLDTEKMSLTFLESCVE